MLRLSKLYIASAVACKLPCVYFAENSHRFYIREDSSAANCSEPLVLNSYHTQLDQR